MAISYLPEQNEYKEILPFRRFVLQSFPWINETFDALTNYELMGKIIEYLNTIISNENIIEGNMQNLYDAFVQLFNYINDLDVQDEVNQKLDEMAEDGTLQEIMGAYLNSKAVFGFDNVSSMKSSTNLINGSFAQTLGFYSKNDGGGAIYKIRSLTNEDVINEIDKIALSSNNLIAELVNDENSINILKLGCVGDGLTDNTSKIQRGIDLYNNIYIPNGKFLISNSLIFKRYTKITGENKVDSIILMDPNENETILKSYNFDNLKGQPSPYWQWNENTICFFEFRNFRIDGNYRNSTNVVNKQTGNGIEIYGASFIIDDVYIDNCAGVGLYLEWTNPENAQTYFRAGNQIAKIDVDIFNCGEEGLINNLGDSEFRRLFMGNCGIKGTSTYMNSTTECHGVIMEKGCEIDIWHIYGCTKGYGIYLKSAVRFRAESLIIESCCGGLYTTNTTHYAQITNLQMHNMMYSNSNYNGEFHYLDYNGTRPFLIANCTIQEWSSSEDLDLIFIVGSDLAINNLHCLTNIYKTKSVLRGGSGTNTDTIGRTTIKGTIENCNLVIKGKIGNASNIDLNIINCNKVVEDSFTIGTGSKVNFTGSLYTGQKFSDNLISHPPVGAFSMNMNVDGVNMKYPGLTNTANPVLTDINTNKYASLSYRLPFLLDINEIVAYMYKETASGWGSPFDVNIVVSANSYNSGTGYCSAQIKYVVTGTALSSAHDYKLIGKYGY